MSGQPPYPYSSPGQPPYASAGQAPYPPAGSGPYQSPYDMPPGSQPNYPPNQGLPMQNFGSGMDQGGGTNYFYPPLPVPVQSNQVITQPPGPGMMGPFGGPPAPQAYEPGGPFMPPPHYGYGQYGPGMMAPIQHQPQAQFHPQGVPPGLEPLLMMDTLFIKQKVELLEAFLGCETKNKYTIKNIRKEKLFSAKEDTDCCTRNLCGSIRPFDLKIKDDHDREVIHLSRPLACDSCLCPCWLQSIDVYAPVNQLAGRVVQDWSICSPSFSIQDATGVTVLRIEGPTCTFSICGDVEFPILSLDGQKVGKISKQWSGVLREAFTDADNFGITFPMDLDVRMKAVMLGAAFLIDFMFFEKTNNKENDGIGMLS